LHNPLAYILGDADSQDCLCGCYGRHAYPRISRSCYINYNDCKKVLEDDFSADVKVVLDNSISDRSDRRESYNCLKLVSQHADHNAFNGIDFAKNPWGIHGATPHNLMHMFLEGIMKYASKIISHRSSEKRNMLRTNFAKGMMNLTTMLTADEQAAIVLMLVIVAQLDEGRELLSVNFDPDSPDTLPEPKDVLDIANINDECVEKEDTQENGTENTFTRSTTMFFYTFSMCFGNRAN
jgi:hypothetical protein